MMMIIDRKLLVIIKSTASRKYLIFSLLDLECPQFTFQFYFMFFIGLFLLVFFCGVLLDFLHKGGNEKLMHLEQSKHLKKFPNPHIFLYAAQCINITFNGKNCKIRWSLTLCILTVKFRLIILTPKFSFLLSTRVSLCCAMLEALIPLLHCQKTFLMLE